MKPAHYGLIALALVAAAAIGFLIGAQLDPGTTAPVPEPDAPPAMSSPAARTTVEIEAPSVSPGKASRGASAEPEPQSLPTVIEAAETRPIEDATPWRPVVPRIRNMPEIFEAKYAGANLDELRTSLAKVKHDLDGAKKLALDERQASGQFVRRKMVEGGVAKSPGEGFTLKLKSGDHLARVFNDGSPDGAGVVWLPPENYIDIYFLYDEWSWLATATWQAEQGLKQQGK